MENMPFSDTINNVFCKSRPVSLVGSSSFSFQHPKARGIVQLNRDRVTLVRPFSKGASPFLQVGSYGLIKKKILTVPRSNISSNSGGNEDNSAKQDKTPFGYSRKDVLLIGLGVTLAGIGLKSGLEFVGVDPLQAGNVVQLVLVLGFTVGWISTYIFRVSNKEMTYAQQLRNYESQVMEKRLESLTEAELEALLEQVEEEKREQISGEQAK